MAKAENLKEDRTRLATAVAVSMLILLYMLLPTCQRLYALAHGLAETSEQTKDAANDVAKMKAEKKALRDDPLYLERVIREDLRMVRPGEIVCDEALPAPEPATWPDGR